MSILQIVKCEVCEHTWSSLVLPESWHALSRDGEQSHFCSDLCLTQWLLGKIALNPDTKGSAWLTRLNEAVLKLQGSGIPIVRDEEPACKVRRFLLVDGETAEITEGVKWANGYVQLDYDAPHCSAGMHCAGGFRTWEEFKKAHDGSGVQWIDREEIKPHEDEEGELNYRVRMIGESESGW